MKRILAVFLTIGLMLSGLSNVYAQDAYSYENVENVEDTMSNASDDLTEDTSDAANVTDDLTEDTNDMANVSYVVISSPTVNSGEKQSIVVGLDEINASSYKLILNEKNTGMRYEIESSKIEEKSILFESEFTDGSYEILSVEYSVNDRTVCSSIKDTGIEAVFGVGCEVDSKPDAYIEDDEQPDVEYSTVIMDENGNTVSENSISGTIDEAEDGIALTNLEARGKNVVVVLDPGHDASHPGARGNGAKEEELTLKIAQYCKTELEKYSNVTVYMTRNSSACPNPNTTSTEDNRARVQYAKSVGADIYVSIHLNSASNGSAAGAEVYYPNANYQPSLSTEGGGLANQILSNLVALGLGNRGIKMKNSEVDPQYPDDETYYPDGSVADYYGVIRNSKRNGIPAIIIEHAFISNASDYNNFLNSDAKLQALGIADAKGIIQYYGLIQETKYNAGDASVTAQGNANQTQYSLSASGVSQAYGVSFAVWSENGGQDDLKWYAATKDGAGNWKANVPIGNHMTAGCYNVHCYITPYAGNPYFVGKTTFQVEGPKGSAPVISNVNNDTGTFDVTVSGVQAVAGIQTVSVGIWSTSDQSDLVWYTAEKQNDGSYVVHMNIAKHQYRYGTYNVHAYVRDNNGVTVCTGGVKQTLTMPTCKISITNNSSQTVFSALAANIIYSNVKQVKFAVWSENGGQDDLKWYTATKNSNNEWKADIPIKNHKTVGIYNAHAYAILTDGSTNCVGGTKFNVEGPGVAIPQIKNVDEAAGTFDAVVSGVKSPSGIAKVTIPVWSEKDQSDIHWYTAEKQKNGDYVAHINISNHKYNYGTYTVHAYATDNNGIYACVGGTKQTLKMPALSISAKGNNTQTVYTAEVKNISYSNVKEVRFAVWSELGGQDDIKWYATTKRNGMSWKCDIPISNHKTAGLYNVHVYATLTSGEAVCLGKTTFNVTGMTADAPAVKNVNEVAGTFDVVIPNVKSVSGVQEIKVPIWSQKDQSDIKWYEAQAQKDGSYIVHANISNHKYNYGTYNIHVYGIAGNGINTCIAGVKYTINMPTPSIVAKANSSQTSYDITAQNVVLDNVSSEVKFAVWSQENGQDDLKWYSANKIANGSWEKAIKISDHKSAGIYNVHAYLYLKNGNTICLGKTTFTVDKVTAGTAYVTSANEQKGTFDVIIPNVKAAAGIKLLQVPVWSQKDQGDIVWYTAEKKDNNYIVHVNNANHKFNYGTYNIHVYATDNNGIYSCLEGIKYAFDMPKPNVTADLNANETICHLSASNVCYGSSIQRLSFAVWSQDGGQDDLVWYDVTKKNGDKWETDIPISNHRTAGSYKVHVYAVLSDGIVRAISNSTTFSVTQITSDKPVVQNLNTTDGTFTVNVSNVSSKSGINKMQVAIWCAKDQSDIVWYNGTKLSNGSYQVYADIANHKNNLGTYNAHVYLTGQNGVCVCTGGTTCVINASPNNLYNIMGSTAVTANQLISYFNSNALYPEFYKSSDAPDLQTFCNMYIQECNAEGIKAEVAFCQAMKETGFLKFNGDVKINQYNFAGLGATGNGNPGNTFGSVREGIRAQVQHLKAYASENALNNSCVDPRYKYVAKGCAPYVEWLGQHENPNGKGWATARNYGYSIKNDYISKLLLY